MAILDNIIDHYKLDETGSMANRNGQLGAVQFVPNGTGVAGLAAKIGNAPDFVTSNFLVANASIADFTTEDFTIAFWIWFDAFPPTQSVPVSKWFSTGRQWQVDYLASSSRLRFLTRNAADNGNFIVSADNFGALSADTWYFVVIQRDATGANEISIRVNNGTRDTLSAGNLPTQTTAMAIGKRDGDPTTISADAHNGKVDELSIWDKLTTDEEESILYNTGSGLAYPWGETPPGSGAGIDGSLHAGGTSKLILPPYLVLP
jgi:hypothetical protein